MRYAATFAILALVLIPVPGYAHGGAGFDFHIFGAPPVINSLIWTAFFTAVAILSLFVLSRRAEERVRRAAAGGGWGSEPADGSADGSASAPADGPAE